MVMPRSRSRSFESMTRSATVSLSRKVPLWRSMASTSVVLPWSTWAMMAMLRILGFRSKTPQDCKLGLTATLGNRHPKQAKDLLFLGAGRQQVLHFAKDDNPQKVTIRKSDNPER